VHGHKSTLWAMCDFKLPLPCDICALLGCYAQFIGS